MAALLHSRLDIARRAECVAGDEYQRRSDVARRHILKIWPRTTFRRYSAQAFAGDFSPSVALGQQWREAQFCYEPDPALMCGCQRDFHHGEVFANCCSECGKAVLL